MGEISLVSSTKSRALSKDRAFDAPDTTLNRCLDVKSAPRRPPSEPQRIHKEIQKNSSWFFVAFFVPFVAAAFKCSCAAAASRDGARWRAGEVDRSDRDRRGRSLPTSSDTC